MADEPTPASGAEEQPETPPASGAEEQPKTPPASGEDAADPAAKRQGLPWLALSVLAALGTLLLLQVAGLLLRDPLEGRMARLTEPPPLTGTEEQEVPVTGTGGARFGPGVREVVVAGSAPTVAPTRPAAAPPPPPATPTPPAASTPTPGAAAALPPAPPSSPPLQPATVAPASGSHALQVGMFRSQRYRHEMEQRLSAARLPSFRREQLRDGVGYRFTIALSEAQAQRRAGELLRAEGYLYDVTTDGLSATFHFEEEAQRALARLAAQGLKGGYTKVEGTLPVWTVFAGPFSLARSKQVRQQLNEMGLRSYLRTVP